MKNLCFQIRHTPRGTDWHAGRERPGRLPNGRAGRRLSRRVKSEEWRVKMTTKQLAEVYKGHDRKAMAACALEAAERIEYLDERLAILTCGEVHGRDHAAGGMTPAQLVWTLRESGSRSLIAAYGSQIAETLEVLDGLVALYSGGMDPGMPSGVKMCLTDRADWPG